VKLCHKLFIAVKFSCLGVSPVSSLKKQCSGDTHLEMDCIPKAVVNIFVSLRGKEGTVGKEKAIDLSSRVDDKLVNTLMPFQREGVE